jgi:hypothetical protein
MDTSERSKLGDPNALEDLQIERGLALSFAVLSRLKANHHRHPLLISTFDINTQHCAFSSSRVSFTKDLLMDGGS